MAEPYQQGSAFALSPVGYVSADLAEKAREFDAQMQLYRDMFAGYQQQGQGTTSLINTYNQAFNAAKVEQQGRYQSTLGALGSMTGQRESDIRSDYAKQQANALQNLNRLGMGNTTIGSTLSQGSQREQQSSLNRLTDQMVQERLGVEKAFPTVFPQSDITVATIGAMKPSFSWPSF